MLEPGSAYAFPGGRIPRLSRWNGLQSAAGVTVLFGPSGSGKTLTLDSIAGFPVRKRDAYCWTTKFCSMPPPGFICRPASGAAATCFRTTHCSRT